METHAPFIMLRARDEVRGESINAGIILMLTDRILVGMTQDKARLKALHPDFGAVDMAQWSARLQTALNEQLLKFSSAEERALVLPLFTSPFVADEKAGLVELEADPEATLAKLMQWQVAPRKAQVRATRARATKFTRLHKELRNWLKEAKAFSTKVEDLNKHRVVANYPIDPASELYADLALMNGCLHVMEVMDLRGVGHLTASMRGEAAVKGITLDEAKQSANAIAIVAASDYGVARPAINMVGRYANDMFDLGQLSERERLASFVGKSLKRDDLLSNVIELSSTQPDL